MITLRIEHKVPSFDKWRDAFDSDPIKSEKMGVKRYHIFRPVDDHEYVIIHLEFENVLDFQVTQAALQKMWTRVEGTIMMAPQTKFWK